MAQPTPTPTSRLDRIHPTLTAAQLARIPAHGRRRRVEPGEVLVQAGESTARLFVIVAGRLDVVRPSAAAAVPSTRWLGGCLVLDANGFIKTGPDLSPEDLAAARWPLARAPYLLETSLPGVFAIGDVRAGSLKRVASAVGEGSIAIAAVDQVLHG